MSRINRRDFIKLGGLLGLPALAPRLVFGGHGRKTAERDVLVCVYQRGGADGLNMVYPAAEGAYYDARPTIALPEPGSNGGGPDLDGFFGLHPDLIPLSEVYQAGELAVVHAVGSPNDSRSHFDAQDFMESGFPGRSAAVFDGWLNRQLQSLETGNASPFRAVGFGNSLQLSLRGEVGAVGLTSLSGFDLVTPEDQQLATRQVIDALFDGDSAIDQVAAGVLSSVDELKSSGAADQPIANGAIYPDTTFGEQLAEIARLIKANLGLEVAAIDLEGWDHHDDESARLSPLLDELGRGLAAFRQDLGELMADVTVLTMTEFGRRVAENGSLGTDHGFGSVMLAMGGGVNGGQVFGDWPGLGTNQLHRGDLDVSTDFRTVLGEALTARTGNANIDYVFPEFAGPQSMGLFRSR